MTVADFFFTHQFEGRASIAPGYWLAYPFHHRRELCLCFGMEDLEHVEWFRQTDDMSKVHARVVHWNKYLSQRRSQKYKKTHSATLPTPTPNP